MKLTAKADIDKTSINSFLKDYFDKGCPETYLDDKIQCISHKRRSFLDLLALVQSYFDCNEELLAYELVNLWESKKIEALYCTDINKVVFYRNCYLNGGIQVSRYTGKNNDYSWDTPEKEGTDGYSFNKIYELAKSKSLINV